MPMTMEQMEAKLGELTTNFQAKTKEFELKLDAQKQETDSWKAVAQQKEAEAKKFKEEAEKAKEAQKKIASEARKSEIKSFLEAKKTAGIITPAQEETLEKLMTSMTSEESVAEFSDKDGKKTVHTQFSLMKEFLNSITGKRVSYGPATPGGSQRQATPEGQGNEEKHFQNVTLKSKGTVEAELDEYPLHMKALEYQEAQRKVGVTVSYEEALIEVSKQEKQAAA